jgi:hypothetical protein
VRKESGLSSPDTRGRARPHDGANRRAGNCTRRASRVVSFNLTMNGEEGLAGTHRYPPCGPLVGVRMRAARFVFGVGEDSAKSDGCRLVSVVCRLSGEASCLPRGSNQAGGPAGQGPSTSIAFETPPTPAERVPAVCSSSEGCSLRRERLRASSEEESNRKPNRFSSSSLACVVEEARKGRRLHARVAHSITCAEIFVVVGLTDSSLVGLDARR